MSCIKKAEKYVVTLEDVALVISSKTGIPIYDVLNDSTKSVKFLKNSLMNSIYGQDEIIEKLISVSKRIKLGYKRESKPYSFLFAGSTGVGKTQLAKIFGSHLVGEENVIKLDMSEYKEEHSISKILGSPPGYVGYEDNNYLLNTVRDKPFSVLIVDEIERAHPSILNLFFQILDDGKIKDSKGREVRFDNVIIIMTTNVGGVINSIGFSENENKAINSLKEQFSVEFLNRLDDVFIFNHINKKSIIKIIKSKLEEVKHFYSNKINISYTDPVVEQIMDMSEYDVYGARKVDKIIKLNVEDIIIDAVINKKQEVLIDKILVR